MEENKEKKEEGDYFDFVRYAVENDQMARLDACPSLAVSHILLRHEDVVHVSLTTLFFCSSTTLPLIAIYMRAPSEGYQITSKPKVGVCQLSLLSPLSPIFLLLIPVSTGRFEFANKQEVKRDILFA